MQLGFAPMVIILGLLAATVARADRQNTGYGDSSKNARNGDQQNLQPDMMQHILQAAQHMKNAQQAEQQQNQGKANQERQMAQMEQQKAQQLGNQIKANEQSAQQNDNGQDMTRDKDPNNGNPLFASNPNVGTPARESTDYNRASTTVGGANPIVSGPSPSDTPSAVDNLPADQLANLSAAIAPMRTMAAQATSADANGAVKTAPDTNLTMISTPKNESADVSNAPPPLAPITDTASNTGSVTTATASLGAPSSALASGPAAIDSTSSQATDRLLASAKPAGALDKDADFWKTARGGDDDSDAVKSKLRGAPAVDDTPGRKLSDAAFWKKAGGEPVSCRINGRATDAKKRARNRCLRETRQSLERKWREKRVAKK